MKFKTIAKYLVVASVMLTGAVSTACSDDDDDEDEKQEMTQEQKEQEILAKAVSFANSDSMIQTTFFECTSLPDIDDAPDQTDVSPSAVGLYLEGDSVVVYCYSGFDESWYKFKPTEISEDDDYIRIKYVGKAILPVKVYDDGEEVSDLSGFYLSGILYGINKKTNEAFLIQGVGDADYDGVLGALGYIGSINSGESAPTYAAPFIKRAELKSMSASNVIHEGTYMVYLHLNPNNYMANLAYKKYSPNGNVYITVTKNSDSSYNVKAAGTSTNPTCGYWNMGKMPKNLILTDVNFKESNGTITDAKANSNIVDAEDNGNGNILTSLASFITGPLHSENATFVSSTTSQLNLHLGFSLDFTAQISKAK